jgi:hypothetical protein
MACNPCGECSYSNASTATLTVIITSAGLPPECRQDSDNLFPNMPYKSPGVWEMQIGGAGKVRVQSKCVSGNWLWSAPPELIGPGEPLPPHCLMIGEENPGQPKRNDCGGFEQVIVTTYIDGAWMRVHITMTVNNNAECE